MVLDVRTLRSASGLEVSDDLRPTTRKARFGDAVTFTFRLVDDDEGDPVLRSGVKFTVRAEESRDNGRHFEGTVDDHRKSPVSIIEIPLYVVGWLWCVSIGAGCSPRRAGLNSPVTEMA